MRVALPFGVGTPEEKRVNYRAALRAAGIEPVEDMDSMDGLHGLLLAGGTDVDPSLYGESAAEGTDEPDLIRDCLELMLLNQALDRDLPVLGICRGIQLFNVAMGGSLIQHVDGHKQPKVRDAHAVTIAPGTKLASILKPGEYMVNSRHHQCAGRAGESLVVAATATGGVIEALESPDHRFVLAVQWHPEARLDSPDLELFRAFAQAI